jgi:transcriptional regulator with XRE-family HTH domain
MKPMTLHELDALLAQDPEYLAAGRELRPDLDLANDVITLRVEAGWSQAELATQVGTNQANISRLESALANPTLKFLKKVARALGADLDVRLRRPDDSPGMESMERFITDLRTVTGESQGAVIWEAFAPIRLTYEVSSPASRSCLMETGATYD